MALLLDTGALYAYYDRDDDWHARVRALVEEDPGPLIVPALVIPEVDHLLGERLGRQARHSFYRGLEEGSYFVADLPKDLVPRAVELDRQYADLDLGFVDAAVLALAEHLSLGRLATTDRRDFAAVEIEVPLELLP